MRVGALIRSYKLTGLLQPVINQYKWCDRILVLNYRFPNVAESEDNTEFIAELNGCEFEKGAGLKQHEIFNRGITLLSDCDCVFISDADEFILKEDQMKVVELIKKYDFVLTRLYDYVDFDHILQQRDHHPIVAVNPKKCEFTEVRNSNGYSFTSNDIYMHHFGYAWKGDELDWKQINKWYDSFHTDLAKPLEEHKCPEEIRRAIESHGSFIKV